MDTPTDTLKWHPVLTIEKWDRTEDYEAGLAPDRVEDYEGNILLTAGITRLLNLLTGAGGTAFNSTNCRIGVGNSTTAAAIGQTDLQGASKYFKLVNGAPGVSSNVVTFVAVFGSAVANFTWEEWGIDNGTTDGTTVVAPLLNRRVEAMGTKASGSTWTVTATITVS
jgi:hypothetical protein